MNLREIKVGDWVLCSPVNVLWDHDFTELVLPTENNNWGPTTWDKPNISEQCLKLPNEWFEVIHTLFDKDDNHLHPVLRLTCMGHPLFAYVEIPKTSYLYQFCTHPFDINEKIYGQDPIITYQMSYAMHGKMVADIFESAILDVRKAGL